MFYPVDLLETLQNVWPPTWIDKDFDFQKLPPTTNLKTLFDVAFHASLLTEEERRISFSILFCPKNKLNKTSTRYPIQPYNLIEFSSPRLFSVQELIRLAPATNPHKNFICVQKLSPNDKNGLEIWGMYDVGACHYDFARGESRHSDFLPPFLTISAIKPGCISISCRGIVLITLKHGEIFYLNRKSFSYGPLSDFFQKIHLSLFQDTASNIKSIEKKFTIPESLGSLRFIERILYHIQEKSHGGALIVFPDRMNQDELNQHLSFKYTCNTDHAWGLFIEQKTLFHERNALYSKKKAGREDLSFDEHINLRKMSSRIEQIDSRLSDIINLIASLSCVDGAVVITDKFRLIGFGAEILSSDSNLESVYINNQEETIPLTEINITNFGTRHRSACRFSHRYPDVILFVISQDGGMKAIKNVDNMVCMWTDIEAGWDGLF
jgi:Probable sensor domain DACNV